MKRVLILLAVPILTGCASVSNEPEMFWYHDTKSVQTFYAESSECEVAANQATAGQRGVPGLSPINQVALEMSLRKNAYNRCMWGQGWYLAAQRRGGCRQLHSGRPRAHHRHG